MDNYTNDNSARRYKAHISIVGTTQLHLRNPYIIAWWSAGFPGFGHLLLSNTSRYVLFMWEILINNMAHINHAIVYSFTGNIGMAKEVLERDGSIYTFLSISLPFGIATELLLI